MKKLPQLADAYALRDRNDVKTLYADWAQSYDAGFGDAMGYQLPRAVALAFVGAGVCGSRDVTTSGLERGAGSGGSISNGVTRGASRRGLGSADGLATVL